MTNSKSKIIHGLLCVLACTMELSCTAHKGRAQNEPAAVQEVKVPEPVRKVDVRQEGDLTIYTPRFTRLDLATETMPDKTDKSVVFVCEAAFTGELLEGFKHTNIAGHHVSGGEFHKGYKCGPNNGVFTWDPLAGWHFYNYSHANSEAVLKTAARNGGMGFCQSLLYHGGTRFKGCFKPESTNQYRALCELDGHLCVIDCARPITFKAFMDALETVGVSEAIYCDMGRGWNYSWYRQDDGTVKEIFPTPGMYTTNWVTFYID